MFHKMPFILLGMILLSGTLYPWIPPTFQSILYGISLSLKSVIIFILPFLIFGLLFKTAVQLARQASKWILLLLISICLSNFISTMMSYLVGHAVYQLDLSFSTPQEITTLIPLGVFSLPKLFNNSYALFAGLLLGLLGGIFNPALAEKMTFHVEKIVNLLLKALLYIVPLFITGFIIKMRHDGVIGLVLRNYGPIFLLIASALLIYITLIYLAANRFQYKATIKSMKNMLPAALTGFGSMSSIAAMPLSILATEKNTPNSTMGKAVIPATVNIHLIGDCFAIPIFAFAIMKSFGIEAASFSSYFIFALYFVLAKFSVASVPGGGILVMLPILETHLGFNGEMLSLITTLYILFDPLITSMNVLGNGGFAMGIEKLIRPSKSILKI